MRLQNLDETNNFAEYNKFDQRNSIEFYCDFDFSNFWLRNSIALFFEDGQSLFLPAVYSRV